MIEYSVKVYKDGTKKWYLDGDLRLNEYANGDKEYFLDGVLHREDGPAVECSTGSKFWFLNEKRHRVDGPAIEWSSGKKEWYINDKKLTEEEFLTKTNKEPEIVKKIKDIIESFGFTVSSWKKNEAFEKCFGKK